MAEAAVGKRIKITKIQQHMLLAALGTSLVFGVSLVFSIFFVKYIGFNSQVISAKDKAISNYYTAITNVGICKTNNADGKYSDKELDECDPEKLNAEDLPGTLRNNILIGMTEENTDLESVARDSQTNCRDGNNRKIDFSKSYKEAKTAEDREKAYYMMKMCSSLRVVPDSLPASRNDVALLSSMNQVFNMTETPSNPGGLRPESLAPSKDSQPSAIEGVEVIPITVSIKSDLDSATLLLQNLEKSIRIFSFQSATFSWQRETNGTESLDFSAQAQAFYTDRVDASTTDETVYASKKAKQKNGGATKTTDAEEE